MLLSEARGFLSLFIHEMAGVRDFSLTHSALPSSHEKDLSVQNFTGEKHIKKLKQLQKYCGFSEQTFPTA